MQCNCLTHGQHSLRSHLADLEADLSQPRWSGKVV